MTRIEAVVSPIWSQNGYVVACEGAALIIDPGAAAVEFNHILDRDGLRLLAILNTHGHFDHLGGVADLAERHAVPFLMSHADLGLLKRANFYRSLFNGPAPIRLPNSVADMAAALDFGPFRVTVLATPGHTAGSTCLLMEQELFSGDTLLPGGLGRVDLPGGSRARMAETASLLVTLDADYRVHPGHGRSFRLSDVRHHLTEALPA